jgi:hypothetical protein
MLKYSFLIIFLAGMAMQSCKTSAAPKYWSHNNHKSNSAANIAPKPPKK